MLTHMLNTACPGQSRMITTHSSQSRIQTVSPERMAHLVPPSAQPLLGKHHVQYEYQTSLPQELYIPDQPEQELLGAGERRAAQQIKFMGPIQPMGLMNLIPLLQTKCHNNVDVVQLQANKDTRCILSKRK